MPDIPILLAIASQQSFGEDPDFDASLNAFYYICVIEIPTLRCTSYDANIFSVEILKGTSTSIQERAYTSPVLRNANNK